MLALLTASSSVAEEIEGKTAVTLLSKPINRRQFILGKFLGIEMGVLALFLLLGVALRRRRVVTRRGTTLREMARHGRGALGDGSRRSCRSCRAWSLGFFEVTVLTAISVAISTRVPMLVNLVVMIAVFFLGHLTPILVEASKQANVNELVQFMARLFQWALPSLEYFNAGPAIATGAVIPWVGYVLPALGYCVLYSGAALLLCVPAVREPRRGLIAPGTSERRAVRETAPAGGVVPRGGSEAGARTGRRASTDRAS